MDVVDSREQRRVQVDRAVVSGEPRRHFALDRLQRRRGLRNREVVEDPPDPIELAAALVDGGERVLEGGRLSAGCDRVDFGKMRAQRLIEGRHEMLGRIASNGGGS
jgi:hypothetical protein